MGMYDAYAEAHKHRRWEYRGEIGFTEAKQKVDEHNALFDAWEAAEARIKELDSAPWADDIREIRRITDAGGRPTVDVVRELVAECAEHCTTLTEAKSTSRPCAVTFSCTAYELLKLFAQRLDPDEKWPQFAVRELSTRARVTVPEGVPTAEEIMREHHFHELHEHIEHGPAIEYCPYEFTRGYLAPYLHPPQKYLRCIFCNHIADTIDELREHSAVCTAHPQHEARKTAEEERDELRERLESDEALATAYENGMRAAQSDDIHIADLRTTGDGRVDILPTGECELYYYLNGRRLVPEPEPIASAETLEQLAEGGHEKFKKYVNENGLGATEWNGLDPRSRDGLVRFVEHILRAAQPYVDELSKELAEMKEAIWEQGIHYGKNDEGKGEFLLPDYTDPPDIATAETLEQLAEIAWNAIPGREVKYSNLAEPCKQNWRNTVTDILRAAQPYVNVEYPELMSTVIGAAGQKWSWQRGIDLCNWRIRYRVKDAPQSRSVPELAVIIWQTINDAPGQLSEQEGHIASRYFLAAQRVVAAVEIGPSQPDESLEDEMLREMAESADLSGKNNITDNGAEYKCIFCDAEAASFAALKQHTEMCPEILEARRAARRWEVIRCDAVLDYPKSNRLVVHPAGDRYHRWTLPARPGRQTGYGTQRGAIKWEQTTIYTPTYASIADAAPTNCT